MIRAQLTITDDSGDSVQFRRGDANEVVIVETMSAHIVYLTPDEARQVAEFFVALANDIEAGV